MVISRSARRGALDEYLLGGSRGFACGRVAADVLAVGLHVPGRAVVLLVGAQDGLENRRIEVSKLW